MTDLEQQLSSIKDHLSNLKAQIAEINTEQKLANKLLNNVLKKLTDSKENKTPKPKAPKCLMYSAPTSDYFEKIPENKCHNFATGGLQMKENINLQKFTIHTLTGTNVECSIALPIEKKKYDIAIQKLNTVCDLYNLSCDFAA